MSVVAGFISCNSLILNHSFIIICNSHFILFSNCQEILQKKLYFLLFLGGWGEVINITLLSPFFPPEHRPCWSAHLLPLILENRWPCIAIAQSINLQILNKECGGAGIAQWLEHRTRDWKVAGSNPCWNGGRIFFSRVDFLCWLLFRYPFHPRVTTVARKKSRSFCQKCRWQVTAKHAYTLRMWILLNRASALVTTCP